VAGHAPIYGRKIKYYEDAVFSERAKVALPAAPAQEAA
jgi:type IV secretory pathway TraG/TraD family ATPase VirD4